MPTGSITTTYDVTRRTIHIAGIGLWSTHILEQHFEKLSSALHQARSHDGFVRVLSDLREAELQEAAIAKRISDFTAKAYRLGDRIAIVVASSLVKMQMRQSVHNKETQLFLSPTAAKTWLYAYEVADIQKVQAIRS